MPKLPVKQDIVITPPAIQLEIAEIVEQSDAQVLEKIEFIKTEDVTEPNESESYKQVIQFNDYSLKAAMVAFAERLTPSTAALVKMFDPKIEGNEIKVSMHKSNVNLIEPIKVEWQRFLRDYFNSRDLTLSIIEDRTVIQQTKAYTQREQLDEIVKDNPLVKDFLKKLNLKLK